MWTFHNAASQLLNDWLYCTKSNVAIHINYPKKQAWINPLATFCYMIFQIRPSQICLILPSPSLYSGRPCSTCNETFQISAVLHPQKITNHQSSKKINSTCEARWWAGNIFTLISWVNFSPVVTSRVKLSLLLKHNLLDFSITTIWNNENWKLANFNHYYFCWLVNENDNFSSLHQLVSDHLLTCFHIPQSNTAIFQTCS